MTRVRSFRSVCAQRQRARPGVVDTRSVSSRAHMLLVPPSSFMRAHLANLAHGHKCALEAESKARAKEKAAGVKADHSVNRRVGFGDGFKHAVEDNFNSDRVAEDGKDWRRSKGVGMGR